MVKRKGNTPEFPDDQEAALKILLASLEKTHGKGVVSTDITEYPVIERIPTGSIALDEALNGGWARGRLIELHGMESAGKSSLCLHATAEAQAMGLRVAYLDAENALDLAYAEMLGVDVKKILFSQPENAEQALNIVDTMIRSGAIGLIIVDSVANLIPQAELSGEIGQSHMGLQARLMNQALRKFAGIVKTTNTTIIFVNQMRQKMVSFGDPNTTTGGLGLRFACSQMVDIRRIGTIGGDDLKTGILSKVKVIKSKVGPPFKVVEIEILFGSGINKEKELIDLGMKKKLITKSGSWYTFTGPEGEEKYQSLDKLMRADEELKEKVRKLVSCTS